jgi:hypothetical protein
MSEEAYGPHTPFQIEGPATISFSGGRTSAYMLWRILQAHGGTLPGDIHVVFANTGRERAETLRFVHEVGSRWGIRIVWVEWRDNTEGFEVVGYNSASRAGEPFEALIRKKKRLPNWKERWCTGFLKVAAMHAYLGSIGLEFGSFVEVIGLRADEGARILRGTDRAKKDGRVVHYPLGLSRVLKADVMKFWAQQDFDLGLQPHEGNCDFCFLKGRGLRKRLIRDVPGVADWWNRLEQELDQWFDRRDTVKQLIAEVVQSPEFEWDDGPGYDNECSDVCGGESPAEIEILNRMYLRTLEAA